MSPVSSPRPGFRAVLLGGFIVWQLGFILAANFLPFLHAVRPQESDPPGTDAPGPGAEARLGAGRRVLGLLDETLGHWSNLTGQLQGWSLYAPYVPTQATFVAVELRWDDPADWPGTDEERVSLHSAIEPGDPRHYFRPFCTFRLPAYEANLGLVMWAWDETSAAQEPDVWRQRIAAAVRRQCKPIHAYLRWRLASFEGEHPEAAPPTQVILLAHIYRIPSPDQAAGDYSEPVKKPIARWQPGADVPPGVLPLESYNPATDRFDRITKDE